MVLRELQKLAHDLRSFSSYICRTASLTGVSFRAAPDGIIVNADWGTGQLQIVLGPSDLTIRPCDNSREVARRILRKRTGGERTTDAKDDPGGDPIPGAAP